MSIFLHRTVCHSPTSGSQKRSEPLFKYSHMRWENIRENHLNTSGASQSSAHLNCLLCKICIWFGKIGKKKIRKRLLWRGLVASINPTAESSRVSPAADCTELDRTFILPQVCLALSHTSYRSLSQQLFWDESNRWLWFWSELQS